MMIIQKNDYFIFSFVIGLVICQTVDAQNYDVIESTMAYKHINQDSTSIKTGDRLFDNDVISINNKKDPKGQQITVTGSLAISLSSGNIRKVSGQYHKQQLQDIFFPSLFTSLKDKVILFFKGLFDKGAEDTKPAVHLQGSINYIKGLCVSFVCNDRPYTEIDSVPLNSLFDLNLTNNTDSVLFFAISFKHKLSDNTPYTSYIIQQKTDGDPLILVPGESVSVPSPFLRIKDYYVYHINIYGSPHVFGMRDENDSEFMITTETPFDLTKVQRYYYVSNE